MVERGNPSRIFTPQMLESKLELSSGSPAAKLASNNNVVAKLINGLNHSCPAFPQRQPRRESSQNDNPILENKLSARISKTWGKQPTIYLRVPSRAREPDRCRTWCLSHGPMTRNSYKFLITIHAVAFQDAWPDARSTRGIYICSVMGNSKFGLDTAVTGRKRSLSYLGECSEHINLG